MLPAIAGPGLVTLFAGARNGPKAPGFVAGLHIEGSQITAVRRISAGDTDDHFVFDQQRRAGDIAAALAHVLDVDAPLFAARFLIERNNSVIERPEKDAARANSNA